MKIHVVCNKKEWRGDLKKNRFFFFGTEAVLPGSVLSFLSTKWAFLGVFESGSVALNFFTSFVCLLFFFW